MYSILIFQFIVTPQTKTKLQKLHIYSVYIQTHTISAYYSDVTSQSFTTFSLSFTGILLHVIKGVNGINYILNSLSLQRDKSQVQLISGKDFPASCNQATHLEREEAAFKNSHFHSNTACDDVVSLCTTIQYNIYTRQGLHV